MMHIAYPNIDPDTSPPVFRACVRYGDFRKRLYYARVRMPSGSSRYMKPCSLWEGKS